MKITATKEQYIARFWNYVDKKSPNECWPWKAGVSEAANGDYGCFNMNGSVYKSHRLAFEFSGNTLPKGIQVLHKCDNPICCNPNHLFTGTNADNVADKVSKGRQAKGEWFSERIKLSQPKGEDSPRAKLTTKDVIEIRKLHAEHLVDYATIGRRFGITKTQARYIVIRKSWTHI